VRNHKKSKNKYDNKCTLDVWEKIVKKCGWFLACGLADVG
jgi:hypothetical protein